MLLPANGNCSRNLQLERLGRGRQLDGRVLKAFIRAFATSSPGLQPALELLSRHVIRNAFRLSWCLNLLSTRFSNGGRREPLTGKLRIIHQHHYRLLRPLEGEARLVAILFSTGPHAEAYSSHQ